jgi:hypothetical protein
MFALKNVSSPFVVSGSDTDLELWLPAGMWAFVVAVLATLGIGHLKRSRTHRIELGPLVELFLIDADQPDEVTLALAANLATMRGWDSDTAALYLKCKAQLSYLEGDTRKAYKAAMARMFGLDARVYGC